MKSQPIPNRATADLDIIAVLSSLNSFKTLLTALKAAGLTEMLRAAGPMTLFAPNDTAFAKVSSRQLQEWLADKSKLVDLLRHHTILGHLSAADIIKANISVPVTASGRSLSITVRARNIYVGDAQVVKTDIQARNGLIHVVDRVVTEKQADLKLVAR